MLTEEEKRTLVAEGYPVPNKLPLTKSEEKALKRVRRKIKNKVGAPQTYSKSSVIYEPVTRTGVSFPRGGLFPKSQTGTRRQFTRKTLH